MLTFFKLESRINDIIDTLRSLYRGVEIEPLYRARFMKLKKKAQDAIGYAKSSWSKAWKKEYEDIANNQESFPLPDPPNVAFDYTEL